MLNRPLLGEQESHRKKENNNTQKHSSEAYRGKDLYAISVWQYFTFQWYSVEVQYINHNCDLLDLWVDVN